MAVPGFRSALAGAALSLRETDLPANRLSGIENQFLYPPVVHVRDENDVFGWARQPMRPIELFRAAAGLAEHAENLAVEGELVQSTGLIVDGEQILSWAISRDTERPRWRSIRRVRIRIAQRRMPFLVIGDVEPDELLEAAIRIENLNASIAAVGHVDVALAIDLHVVWISKLAWAGPVRSPGLDPVSVLVHLGDARIDVAVANIDVVFCVLRHIGRPVIQPINRALFRRSGSPELEALVSFRPAAQILLVGPRLQGRVAVADDLFVGLEAARLLERDVLNSTAMSLG